MAEKVDQLMSFIEGKWVGEANDPAVAFTRQSLEELEERIHHLSTECKEFRVRIVTERNLFSSDTAEDSYHSLRSSVTTGTELLKQTLNPRP